MRNSVVIAFIAIVISLLLLPVSPLHPKISLTTLASSCYLLLPGRDHTYYEKAADAGNCSLNTNQEAITTKIESLPPSNYQPLNIVL